MWLTMFEYVQVKDKVDVKKFKIEEFKCQQVGKIVWNLFFIHIHFFFQGYMKLIKMAKVKTFTSVT